MILFYYFFVLKKTTTTTKKQIFFLEVLRARAIYIAAIWCTHKKKLWRSEITL